VLEVGGRRKKELGEDVSTYVVNGAPHNADGVLFDEIVDVRVFYVNVLRLGSSHVVGSKGNATLVVLKGGGWASDGKPIVGRSRRRNMAFERRMQGPCIRPRR
jgi:hypothetical protein